MNGNINGSNGIIAVSINGTAPAFNVSSGSLMLSTNTVFQIDDNVAASGTYPVIVPTTGGAIAGDLPPVSLSRGVGYLQLNAGELDLVAQVPQFISQPADTRADRGTSASFSVSVANTNGCVYQWRKNGVNITGATNAVLTLANVQFADMALYDCVVTAPGMGSNTSQRATLLVDVPNQIAIGYNHFLPNIPYPQSNPHLSGMFGPIALGSTNHSTYGDGKELLGCALAYLSPASPYYGQQAYCDRLKVLIDLTSSYYDTPLTNAGFEAFTFELPYCYYLLKCYHPEQITAAQQALWERRIEYRSNWTVTNNPNVYTGHYTGAVWLNGDNRQAAGAYMGSIIATNYSRATNLVYVFENVFTKCLLGDGGTHYVGYQNEAGDYHTDTLFYEAWIYLVTGSTPVQNMILGTKNFIPLVDHQLQVNPMIAGGTGGRYSGFYENTTVPAWKTYYHGDILPDCALWKAYFIGDGYNYQIGQRASNMDNSSGYDSEAVLWAIFYTPGLVGRPAPDNYMLYDRNTLGPRGRFGNWGEAGTSRNIWSSQPEFNENFPIGNTWGVGTFAGSYLLDSNNFNAAFQGTAPMFKVNANVWTDYELGGGVWSYLSGSNEQNQVTKGRQVYGLSAWYNVAGNNGTPSAWDAQQQWVFTPDRVIGMCEIQNNASSAVYGLGQQIKLVSGRINSGCYVYKPLITVSSNSWTYGNLQVRVPATSYTGPNSSFEFGIWNEVGDTNSTMLVLNDSASYNNTLYTYPAGTRRYALLEVTYAGQTYSLSPTVLSLAAGLQGFEFTEDAGRKVRMVHNLTGSAITYTDTMTCPYNQLRMLLSWDDTAFNEPPINAGSASISISIPAYGHILLINSGINDDHKVGYQTYSSVFEPNIWSNSLAISFGNYPYGDTLTNFPVLVSLSTNLPNFAYSQFASPTGGDLRFADQYGNSLNYEIEQWNTNGISSVWVQVPAFTSNSVITAYWNCITATNPPACTTNGATWNTNYAAVWHMNQTNSPDSTTNDLNALSFGNLTVAGEVAGSQYFNGSAYLGLGDNVNPLSNLPAFSVTWWMQQTNHNAGAQISSDLGSGTNRFIIQDNGATYIYANGNVFSGSSPFLIDNAWHHYALTVANAKGGAWKLYRDGALVFSNSWNFTMSSYQMLLGRHGGNYFKGGLDEVRLANVAHSDHWLWASYQNVASNRVFNTYGSISAPTQQPLGMRLLSVVTSSPTLTSNVSNQLMTLTWPDGHGWHLQSNSVSLSDTNGWQTVSGATPPYQVIIQPSESAVFYRLAH